MPIAVQPPLDAVAQMVTHVGVRPRDRPGLVDLLTATVVDGAVPPIGEVDDALLAGEDADGVRVLHLVGEALRRHAGCWGDLEDVAQAPGGAPLTVRPVVVEAPRPAPDSTNTTLLALDDRFARGWCRHSRERRDDRRANDERNECPPTNHVRPPGSTPTG